MTQVPKWFDVDPVDESYLDTAEFTYRYVIDVRASADEVWAGLTDERPLSWCTMLTDVHYTSATPYQVGTTRVADVGRGVLQLREEFFLWDNEIRRHSFYVTQANVPLFGSFAEDYRVEPTAIGSRFTWTFAFNSRRGFAIPVRLGLPVNKALFASFVRDTRKHFSG